MNRFDASTIWKSACESEADSGQAEADPDEPTSDGEAHILGADGTGAPSDFPAGKASATGNASAAGDGPDVSAVAPQQSFFVPLHYESNYRYPLIVWLHSDGYNENQVCHVMPHVSLRNYVATGVRGVKAIDPSGHRFQWAASAAALRSGEQCVLRSIDRATKRYSIHPDRIVLAGYREGGTMALRIAMRYPYRFAAAVALGGQMPATDSPEFDRQALLDRQLPMLWQRSLEAESFDPNVLTAELRSAARIRAQLEVRQYRNEDEMNTAVLADFDRWVMQHVVAGTSVGRIDRWESSPTSFSDN